jgi:sugar/nucleoside kinase (ribokinase family)
MPVNWLNKPENLFKVLVDFCPGIIVITNGGHGAHAFDNGKIYYQKSLSKKIVDTTGAGDSFCASFTAGYIFYRGNIEKALKLGAINSAYNLTGIGAQDPLLSRKETERLMKK